MTTQLCTTAHDYSVVPRRDHAKSGLPAAVLWDMDGTLLDSEPLWDIVMTELALKYGIEMTPDLQEITVGNSLPQRLSAVYTAAGLGGRRRGYEHDRRWMIERITGLFATDLAWRPGARESLELLAAARIPMALVTNTVREVAEVALRVLGPQRFAVTICGDEVSAAKPSPDPYRDAARLLGVSAACCLAVEDSVIGGRAAGSAGCPALMIPSSVVPAAHPLRVLRDSLTDLTLVDIARAWTAAHATPMSDECCDYCGEAAVGQGVSAPGFNGLHA